MNNNRSIPFGEIKSNLDRLYGQWVMFSFAGGSTFRMFADFSKVREFLRTNTDRLIRHQTAKRYDRTIRDLASQFRRSGIRCSDKSRPRFGHAVKVLNLYVKQYCSMPCFMRADKLKKAHMLLRRAHVPLDRIVLKRIWRDFQSELEENGIKRIPKLKTLREEQYVAIQAILRKEAGKQNLPAVSYDLLWADRRK
jgi:hypothetical protein